MKSRIEICVALFAGVVVVLTLLLTLWLRTHESSLRERLVRQNELLQRVAPDLARATHYACSETLLQEYAPLSGSPPTPDNPPATSQELRRLPPLGTWEGVQLELCWAEIETLDAFRIVNRYAKRQSPWRLAGLKLVAAEQQERSSLELLLESAVPLQ